MNKSKNSIIRSANLSLVVLFACMFLLVEIGIAQQDKGWESAAPAKLDYWNKKLALKVKELKKINVNQTFHEGGEIIQLPEIGKIFGLALNGTMVEFELAVRVGVGPR